MPDRITTVTTDVPPTNGMAVATDAKTPTRIRTKLAGLRDPEPAGRNPGPLSATDVDLSNASAFTLTR